MPTASLASLAARIARLDRSKMLDALWGFPEQCRHADQLADQLTVPSSYQRLAHLVITGMGGSAIGGDLVRCAAGHRSPWPIVVNRQYGLPGWVSRESLVVAVSYSGNTEETLSAYREARRRRAKLVAIASGGRLLAMARRDRIPCLAIPTGYAPRAALGYGFVPLYRLWARLASASRARRDLVAAIDGLARLRHRLAPNSPLNQNPAYAVARALAHRHISLYGSQDYLEAAVYRWRTQIEENAKQLASHHLLPEMTHNEVVGWVKSNPLMRQVTAVFLTDRRDHPRITKRIQWTTRWIRGVGGRVLTIEAAGPNRLARLLHLIYLGDFASYYLALLNGQDPTPVAPIQSLKAWMR